MLADELPDGDRIELLRSALEPARVARGYWPASISPGLPCGAEGDRESLLPGVFGAARGRREQKRPAGNRLESRPWVA
jgi:hypothetical protein